MASILTTTQRRFLRLLIGLALFVLANSTYLYLADGDAITGFYQVMLLAHLGGGTLLLVLSTFFVVWHLKRVKKLLRFGAVSTGVALTVAAYVLFASGIFILSEANSRDHRWIFYSHRILAIGAPLLYGWHRWISHFPPKKVALTRATIAFGLMLGLMMAGNAVWAPIRKDVTPIADWTSDPFLPFQPTNFPDKSSPFFPAPTTTDSGGFFPARIITRGERGDFERIREDVERLGFAADTTIGSATCARCHADIVEQWKASAHRFSSFNNPFYRAAVERLRDDGGLQESQFCAGCHDPAIMLAGNMTKEIDPLTPESQAGLTCLSCHAIDRLHGVVGNGNYNVADETPSPYLFDDASGGLGRFTADLLIKSKPGEHKRALLKPFFRKAEYCSTCHKVSLDVPINGYRWLRGQDEYDAWHDSGVSHNAARTFYLPGVARQCQDCHMPREPAPLGDVSARDGMVRSHRFLAVNTALPYIRGDFETIRRMESFLAGRLRIDIFAMQRETGERVLAVNRVKPRVPAGETVIFEVVVRNKGVGHTFPGGTNDSNQGWIDFSVTDESGREIYRSGALDETRRVDPSAHFYRVVMVRHDGTEGSERDAQNFHVPAFARVIGPGTADLARYEVRVPADAKGKLRIEAKLNWRKFNRDYTEFVFKTRGMMVPDLPHLKGQEVPDLPITLLASDSLGLAIGAPADDARAAGAADWERFNDHGIANLLQGAFDIAERSFAEVARLRPELPDGYRNQARRWIQSATPARAFELLKRVDEVAPDDPQRAYFWGRYFQRIEDFEQAVKAYRASLDIFPRDRDGWRRLGTVLFKLARYEESLKAYLEVLRIDPEDLQGHKRRLDIYRLLGRESEAKEAAKAFDKYKRDDQAQQLLRDFLLEHAEINEDAQPRHVHR